jgi:hypothetical protein
VKNSRMRFWMIRLAAIVRMNRISSFGLRRANGWSSRTFMRKATAPPASTAATAAR